MLSNPLSLANSRLKRYLYLTVLKECVSKNSAGLTTLALIVSRELEQRRFEQAGGLERSLINLDPTNHPGTTTATIVMHDLTVASHREI